ncbi:putative ABC transport system permease protein [Devosia crocina]|uniref:Putative ABC transport system permease protein n=1 Tax=Devosia crocina TaxID=429728 RepID=A0A1I7NJG5_9HYPH|nr:FtsX-like permease family protein [Devosia crocina]SFV34696.1 putative ABC transport system permease protein [Devosia crocina]
MNPLGPLYRAIEWMPIAAQDAVVLLVLLLPALVVGGLVIFGYRPFSLVRAMLWRFRWTNLLFIGLIAVSVGIGVGLIAQERGLRQGTARAADPFDLIVAAPGSEITMLFAAVYLQPSDVPLLSGDTYQSIATAENVSLAAPIAFGDSYNAYPIVGSTPQFVTHMSPALVEGAMFRGHADAVIGSGVDLTIGATFTPAHGVGDAVEHDAHAQFKYTVVGRMQPTGSPWDRSIVVPVEAVWEVHGLANGHAPERADQLGPPFDPDYFPGTPAVLVSAEQLYANYALRAQFQTAETMAFFPGAVLASLHGLMGDVRQVMSVMAVITQVLVTTGVLVGLVILMRLFARRLALLRALGAPSRFVFSVVWSYAATLIFIGAVAGVGVGFLAAAIISRVVTAQTDILVNATLSWPEFHLVAGFISLTVLLALVPAFIALSRPVITDLRS